MTLYLRDMIGLPVLSPRGANFDLPLKFHDSPLHQRTISKSPWSDRQILATTTKPYPTMSAQGVVDAVKDGVQQVADKLQNATVQDSNAPAAATTTDEAKPNETKPQTLLDEVTGEYVSKSELKKRQKQRQKDIAKAEKESTRQAPPAPKKKNAADDEAQLNPNVSEWQMM
jgi:hypothetical protein